MTKQIKIIITVKCERNENYFNALREGIENFIALARSPYSEIGIEGCMEIANDDIVEWKIEEEQING